MKTPKLDLQDVKLENLFGDAPLDDDLPGDDTGDNDGGDNDDDPGSDEDNGGNAGDDDGSYSGDDTGDDKGGDDTERDDPDSGDDADDAGDSGGDNNELSVVQELARELGIEIGEDESFEDSIDGMKKFTSKAAEQMAAAQLQSLFEQMPDVEEYVNYRLNGGDPKAYQKAAQAPDYESMEIKEENVALQKQVLRDYLTRQGYEGDELEETLQDYEETGLMFKHSQKAQKRMAAEDKIQKAEMIKQQEKAAEIERKKNEETWKEIKGIVDGGELQGVVIPKTEQKKFFDWMSKPVDSKGNTARTLARGKMDTQTMLTLEYLLYKQLNLGDLVTRKAQSANARTLRDRLKDQSSQQRLPNSRSKASKPTKLPSLGELI